MKKILFALTLFLTSCGYQAINKIDKTNFIVSKYDFLGNPQINKILKRNFDKNKKNDNLQNEFEIIVNSKLIKSNNSKNRAGEVTNLTIQIIVDLEISLPVLFLIVVNTVFTKFVKLLTSKKFSI